MASSGEIEHVDSSISHFPNFDVVTGFDDHHYIKSKSSKQPCLHEGNSPVYATIMKEWRILKKNLPDSIYVRVHESRIDLLRAVIIGPAGTPYHDGLFFFDIRLPSNYPHSPPKVHYHSYGYHINPIISSNGKLCLSLINTHSGSGTEKWTPRASTVLQLLISIQGLVLNAAPYFDGLGSGINMSSKSKLAIKLSLAYNENAFIESCKTMIQIMQKPPKNLEDFVAQHFRLRSASILAAIKGYQRGAAVVGEFQTNAGSSSAHRRIKVRSYFKERLMKVEGELQRAFARLTGEPIVVTVESMDNVSVTNGGKKKTGFWKKLFQCFISK